MALTVDTSWRWSLSEAAEGRGNQAYLRFWKNALRWLMKDNTVSRVTVRASDVIGLAQRTNSSTAVASSDGSAWRSWS